MEVSFVIPQELINFVTSKPFLLSAYGVVALVFAAVVARWFVRDRKKQYPTIGGDDTDKVLGILFGLLLGMIWPVLFASAAVTVVLVVLGRIVSYKI